LFFDLSRTTFRGVEDFEADEIAMSALEAYALFGAPLLMFATGLAAYFLTRPRKDERQSLAE
jgi:hypothetical protein